MTLDTKVAIGGQLAEFAGAHTAPGGADEWFRTMVMPAILSMTLGGEAR